MLKRHCQILVAALAALATGGTLAAATPALAAWNAPVALTGASGYAPQLAFDTDGGGALLWDSARAGSSFAVPYLAPLVSDVAGTPAPLGGAPAQLAENGVLAALPSSPDLLLAVGPTSPTNPAGRALWLTSNATVQSNRLVATHPAGLQLLEPATLSVNRYDTAATLLMRCLTHSCSRRELYLAIEGSGPGFLAPIPLASVSGAVTAGAVSVNGNGIVLAAWAAQGGVYARERKSSGALTRTARLGSSAPTHAGESTDIGLAAYLAYSGRGVVAWESGAVGSGTGAPHGAVTALTAVSNVHGSFATAAQRLTSFTYDRDGFELQQHAIALTQSDAGTILALWTARQGGHFAVRAAPLGGGSAPRFSGAQTLSDPSADAYLDAAAPSPSGAVLALWTVAPELVAAPDYQHAQLVSAVRPPGASGAGFSGPGALTPTQEIGATSLAFDPHSATALVAFAGQPTSAGYPQIETVSGSF